MKTILDLPRDITIGGHTERYRDYVYLGERIDIVIGDIQRAESRIDADPSEAAEEWAYIARSADHLEALLVAQEQWLADHDEEMEVETERLRREIRNLNNSAGMIEEEAGG